MDEETETSGTAMDIVQADHTLKTDSLTRSRRKLKAASPPHEGSWLGSSSQIKGFHHVTMLQCPDQPSYDIVKYNVASHPVSFHHPLHWFLGELLEHIDVLDDGILRMAGLGGFRNVMLNSAEPTETEIRTMLRILDYPLRGNCIFQQSRSDDHITSF
jgi:hypothetical protein